jgi:hypothetical protein
VAWALLAGLALLGTACRCDPPLTQVTAGFRASPTALDFGRVLEGDPATEVVTLTALTRAAVTVTASADAPFSVPASLEVPGGTEASLAVTFTAGATEASGVLHLTDGTTSIDVPLHAVGVHPLTCTPSGPCATSTYALQEDRCVAGVLADDTWCDPGEVCLEQGRCQTGQCVAVPRRCDDNNACTDDGCAAELGCVHTAHACPTPANPCMVATCDAAHGCGETRKPDTTPCGLSDCVSFGFCLAGVCQRQPTPEGAPCAPVIACLAEGGKCHNQECEATPFPWRPRWVAPLSVEPAATAPVLLAQPSSSNLFFSACGLGGVSDGGACGLMSFTSTGFDRFATPYGDGQGRRLVQVTDRGVLTAGAGGLEFLSATTGTPTEAYAGSPPLEGVAATADGTVLLLVGDGGLDRWTQDAGLERLAAVGGARALALDEAGRVFAWDDGARLLWRLEALDGGPDGGALDGGGLDVQSLAVDAGGAWLTAVSGRAVVGSEVVVAPHDGGLELLGLDQRGWPSRWLERGRLQSSTQAFSFSRRCPTPLASCAAEVDTTWLLVHALSTGQVVWEVEVLTPDAGTHLWEAALLAQGGVATVSQVVVDGGVRAALQAFYSGVPLFVCPLPEESSRLEGALLANGSLYVIVERPDGGFALESYALGALPLATDGWTTAEGAQGTRRAQ